MSIRQCGKSIALMGVVVGDAHMDWIKGSLKDMRRERYAKIMEIEREIEELKLSYRHVRQAFDKGSAPAQTILARKRHLVSVRDRLLRLNDIGDDVDKIIKGL